MTYHHRLFGSCPRFQTGCSEHEGPYPTDHQLACTGSIRGKKKQSRWRRRTPWACRLLERAAVACVQLVAVGEPADKKRGEQAESQGSEAFQWLSSTLLLLNLLEEPESLRAAQTHCQLGWCWWRPVQVRRPNIDISKHVSSRPFVVETYSGRQDGMVVPSRNILRDTSTMKPQTDSNESQCEGKPFGDK